MSKRIATFDITPEAIKEALGIPESSEIVNAEWIPHCGAVRFYVEDQGFPETKPGDSFVAFSPVVSYKIIGERVVDWDWNFRTKA